jgi:hypothetical protein
MLTGIASVISAAEQVSLSAGAFYSVAAGETQDAALRSHSALKRTRTTISGMFLIRIVGRLIDGERLVLH